MSADYHTHTPLCHHAEGSAEHFVEQALKEGLTELGISDHCPWQNRLDAWRMDRNDWPAYLTWYESAKRAAAGKLAVRLGLEVDYLPESERWLSALLSWEPFDYAIGSVHYLEPGWDFDHPEKAHRIEAHGVQECWKRYAQLYEHMLATGLFQIAAHLDLVKKFGHFYPGDELELFSPVLTALKRHKVAVEINTAGWHKPCAEAYPSKRLLRGCFERDIAVVLSSDAHRPEEVGRDFARARELAREVGYTKTVLFSQKKPRPVPL